MNELNKETRDQIAAVIFRSSTDVEEVFQTAVKTGLITKPEDYSEEMKLRFFRAIKGLVEALDGL